MRGSARSAAGYAKAAGFVRTLLPYHPDCRQNERRWRTLCGVGAKSNQVTVTGSLKFDISVTPQLAAKAVTLRRQWAPHRPVCWIATSTHDGEEGIVISPLTRRYYINSRIYY